MNPHVEAATARLKQKQLELIQTVQREYPVGTEVSVLLGTHVVQLRVSGHRTSHWHCPGQMFGVNLKTQKQREFYDRNILEVLSR